jgi:hypothetical protein
MTPQRILQGKSPHSATFRRRARIFRSTRDHSLHLGSPASSHCAKSQELLVSPHVGFAGCGNISGATYGVNGVFTIHVLIQRREGRALTTTCCSLGRRSASHRLRWTMDRPGSHWLDGRVADFDGPAGRGISENCRRQYFSSGDNLERERTLHDFFSTWNV